MSSQDKIKQKNENTLIACSHINKLKMAGLKARIIILICHIEGIFHKLIRNQAAEYIENSLFQLCKKEPLRKSCCFLALCSSCIKMLIKAKDDSLCYADAWDSGTPHYGTLASAKLKLPRSQKCHDMPHTWVHDICHKWRCRMKQWIRTKLRL